MPEQKRVLFSSFLERIDIPIKRQKPFLIQVMVLLAAVVIILFIDPNSFSLDVAEGQASPKTIRSPRDISLIDERQTNEARRIEAEKIEPVLERIDGAEQEMLGKFDRFMDVCTKFFQEWREKDPTLLAESVITSSFAASDRLLTLSEISELIVLTPKEFELMKSAAKQILQNLCQKVITARNLENMRSEVKKQVGDFPFGGLGNRLATELIRNSLKINAIENEKLTRQKREVAARQVIPVVRKFDKGQVIVQVGENLSEHQVYILRTIEKQIKKNRLLSLLGNILLTGLLIVISLLHLRFTQHAVLKDDEMFRLMCGLWIGAILLGKVAYALGSAYDRSYLSLLLAPLPAIGLLMALLLDYQVAIFQQMLLGVLMFVVAESEARMALISLLGGVIGILVSDFPMTHSNVRASIGWAGVKIGIGNFVGLLAFLMIDAENFSLLGISGLSAMLLAALGNGILTAILTNGVLPYIESFFALATGARLLELADLAQPLIKRLAEEAPGTYQHSIMVANLAEAAAKEVKADALLVKIGGYYHDIGKLKRPLYFGENQSTKNQHDHLTPYMSSLILVGHIRDGIDLAREYGLPDRVISFITQHHGTTLITYFYQQATTATDGQEVNQERFRYPGPKPQTKESAIVMLADSVEAAARTLPQYSHSRIEALVQKIIDHKLNDENQLDESDLTLKDLEKIEQSFVRVLTSMYHSRVDYPGKLSNQPKGGTDGSPHKQPAKEN